MRVLGALDPAAAAYDFGTMDPSAIYGTGPALAIMRGLVTRSLTQYVYDPEQGSMVLVPDLATDLGRPNEDFTEWRYTIRDGVRFEDGTEVTADDVAYGIKRSFDRPTFRQGPYYSNIFLLDGDTYKGPYTSGTEYDGVVVEGDTLTLKMDRPFPDMPYWGAFPAMGPIPQHGSNPTTYGRHPLATGPYKFERFTPKESLTLVRNEEWDPDTDPGRHAYPDRYVFRFTERWESVDALILGDTEPGQTTVSLSRVMPENLATAQDLDRLVVGSGPYTRMLFPDYRKIKQLEVRQALGYAYPYADAARARGLVPGVTALPGWSMFPPGFPGRLDYNALDIEPGETDPDKAKELLEEAGYAPGEYELSWVSTPDSAVTDALLVRSLEAAGFKATPFPVPAEDYSKVAPDPDAPINIRIAGWNPDWPSGGAWIPPLFHSDAQAGGGLGPYFGDPAVDAEMKRIQRLAFEDQPAAWGALDKQVMTEHYAAIVIGYEAELVLHGSRIGGVNVDNVTGTPTWKDIHVTP